jgi:hypothetical protein
MLMRNQKTSLDTDADFALPGMVASFPQTRVFVIKHPVAILKWRTREQRERE